MFCKWSAAIIFHYPLLIDIFDAIFNEKWNNADLKFNKYAHGIIERLYIFKIYRYSFYRNHITNWYLVYRSNGQSLITAQEGQEKWLEDIIVFIMFKICSEQFHDVSHVRSFLMFTNQSKICIGHTRVSRLKLWRLATFFIPAAICQFKLYGIFSTLIFKRI